MITVLTVMVLVVGALALQGCFEPYGYGPRYGYGYGYPAYGGWYGGGWADYRFDDHWGHGGHPGDWGHRRFPGGFAHDGSFVHGGYAHSGSLGHVGGLASADGGGHRG
jgi:hypothetical protein